MAAILQGPNRRPAMLVGVGLGAMLVLFLASQLLGGGGGGGGATTTTTPVDTGATAPESGPRVLPVSAVAESFEVFTVRDPFRPLISVAEPGGTPAEPTAPTAGTGSTGTTGTTGSSGPVGPTGPASGTRVALMEVFVDSGVTKARVRVESTIYTVREGDAFATNFLVVVLRGSCGEFLHADVRFSLCEGQEVVT